MKLSKIKLSVVTTFIKWVLAAAGALIVFSVGYNVFAFFTPTKYVGSDGKQSGFEKKAPNIAEARDKVIKGGADSFVAPYLGAVSLFSEWYVRTFGTPKK